MSTLWYYNRVGGKPKGPVTMANLRVMAACGQLRPGDLLFQEGTKDWVPAGEIPGLCPAGPSATEAVGPAGTDGAAPVAAAAPVADDPLWELGAIADGGQPAGAAQHGQGKSSHHPPAKPSSAMPVVITLVIAGAAMVGVLLYGTHHNEPPPAPLHSAASVANAPVSHSAAYEKAYQEGLTEGQNVAKQWAGLTAGEDKDSFRNRQAEILSSENDNVNLMMRSYEPANDKVQEVKGHADGMRDAMQQAGMATTAQP